MNFRFAAGIALLTVGLSTATHADCTYPKTPSDIPNGTTATEAELVASVTDMKRYDKEINAYAACIDQEASEKIVAGGKALSSDETKKIQTEAAQKHNFSVDDLQKRANDLNAQIKAFKARAPK